MMGDISEGVVCVGEVVDEKCEEVDDWVMMTPRVMSQKGVEIRGVVRVSEDGDG